MSTHALNKDPIRLIYPTPARSCFNAPIEFARVLAVCVLSFFQSSSTSFPVIPSLQRSDRLSSAAVGFRLVSLSSNVAENFGLGRSS